jgi:DNA-binding IscR family transcriptional regulator
MVINLATQHAAELITHLKYHPGTKLHEFCREKGVSKAFMEQIGLKLVRAGILRSNRGPGGGYVLEKQSVTLADVVKVFRGKNRQYNGDLNEKVATLLNTITVI